MIGFIPDEKLLEADSLNQGIVDVKYVKLKSPGAKRFEKQSLKNVRQNLRYC